MKNSEKIDRNQSFITSLDEMIDKNSKVRVIDAYVRSLDVEKLGYHIYTNKVGRPAYNPQDLIGLYIYSYMSRVVSSRMMEQQTYINLEIMRLLHGTHPDHSTIAAFRSKNAEALTNTFHDFTKTCMDLGLIGGRIVSVDGTKLHANNSKKRNYSSKSLSKKIEHIDTQIAQFSKASVRAQEILSTKDLTVLADKGYYRGKDLEECFSSGITPVVARQNPPTRNGMYSLNDFIYDSEQDSFTCPQNKILRKISGNNIEKIVYANKEACRNCPCKEKCFKQDKRRNYRRIHKDQYFKNMYKADCIFAENKELYYLQQELSEHVFGSIKRQLGFPQLNVRTKPKVSGEVSLLFLGYNLKRVMNIIGNTELIRYFKDRVNSIFSKLIRFILIFTYGKFENSMVLFSV